ncbi:UNVERIFIED_CONTAM: hypothetical protein FKN15_068993 [Acipenser sinensis]
MDRMWEAISAQSQMLKALAEVHPAQHLLPPGVQAGVATQDSMSLTASGTPEELEEPQLEALEESKPKRTIFDRPSAPSRRTFDAPCPPGLSECPINLETPPTAGQYSGLLTCYIGELGLGHLPPVLCLLVQGPQLAVLSKDVSCPNKQCKVTEAMLKKAYAAEALATRLGNYTSILVAYQSMLVQSLSVNHRPPWRMLKDLQLVTDHQLQLFKYNGQSLGRGIAALIAVQWQFRLSQARMA